MEFDGRLEICEKLEPSFVEVDLISRNDLLGGKIGDCEVAVSVKRLNRLNRHELVVCIAEDTDMRCVWGRDVMRLIVHVVLHHKLMQFFEVVEVRLELRIRCQQSASICDDGRKGAYMKFRCPSMRLPRGVKNHNRFPCHAAPWGILLEGDFLLLIKWFNIIQWAVVDNIGHDLP